MGGADCDEECESMLVNVKIVLIFVIVILTLAGSYIPWFTKRFFKEQAEIFTLMNVLSAFSAGIIFGAFQSHMVPESIELFHEFMEHEYEDHPDSSMIDFPWNSVCIGGILILLITIDRLAVDHSHHHGSSNDGNENDDPHNHSHHHHNTQALQQLNTYTKNTHNGSTTNKSEILPIENITVHPVTLTNSTNIDVPNSTVTHPAAKDTDPITLSTPTATAATNNKSSGMQEIVVVDNHGKNGNETIVSATGSESPVTVGHVVTNSFPTNNRSNKSAILRVYVFFIALSIHSIFDGLAIGAEHENVDNLYAIMAAVLIHKILDGLALGIPLYLANMTTIHTWTLLFICAISTSIGIGIGMGAIALSDEEVLAEAIVVSMSAGSFLFISLMELLPTALHDGKFLKTKLFAFFLGWLLLLILAGYIHANHGHGDEH